ncbi:21 kDa seed protein-like [Andrographis paniculata]|uniref:21 kDa seed protein-like n=1 Tax=Andrographis paniculata TaxID=175694 RepID=UPI0021E83172|nr:21 kDa seed protein-like [Andrographis paniculata]
MNSLTVPCFFLFFLFLSVAAQDIAVPVLDSDGDELQADQKYTVTHVTQVAGTKGGLSLEYSGPRCPAYVTAEARGVIGIPMIFHPVNCDEGPIYESATVYIKFTYNRVCTEVSAVWKVDDYVDESTGLYFLIAGGTIGDKRSQLKIVKSLKGDEGYSFVSCGLSECTSIFEYSDKNLTRLALGNDEDAASIVFHKYLLTSTSSIM